MKSFKKHRLPADEYVQGILQGNRFILSKAITLIESSLPQDAALADKVLQAVLPASGKAIRIGITGVPGVGKSTFIESLGTFLTQQGFSLAVLAVDPSSPRSRGSIMGDKTRMSSLSQHPQAFIRPSATGSHLGGVARKTRESMLLCEAAGYQIILVETVGVGQSETEVRHMVDFFLLLMLAGAGDELQGIKKGIMEMADALVVHKADGENLRQAQQARQTYANAMQLLGRSESGLPPEIFTCSSLLQKGFSDIWAFVDRYRTVTTENGYFVLNRKKQNLHWFRQALSLSLQQYFMEHDSIRKLLPTLEKQVQDEKIPPAMAARKLIEQLRQQQ